MPRANSAAIAISAAALLAGCVGPTPYEPAADRYGYSERPLEADRYRVTFAGNPQTSRETVETYLLYRAAEVTLQAGKDWFKLAERDTETKTRYQVQPTAISGFGFGRFGLRRYGLRHGYFFTDVAGAQGRPITRYEAFADVLVFAGSKPTDDPDAYDARSVIKTLSAEIARPDAT